MALAADGNGSSMLINSSFLVAAAADAAADATAVAVVVDAVALFVFVLVAADVIALVESFVEVD